MVWLETPTQPVVRYFRQLLGLESPVRSNPTNHLLGCQSNVLETSCMSASLKKKAPPKNTPGIPTRWKIHIALTSNCSLDCIDKPFQQVIGLCLRLVVYKFRNSPKCNLFTKDSYSSNHKNKPPIATGSVVPFENSFDQKFHLKNPELGHQFLQDQQKICWKERYSCLVFFHHIYPAGLSWKNCRRSQEAAGFLGCSTVSFPPGRTVLATK